MLNQYIFMTRINMILLFVLATTTPVWPTFVSDAILPASEVVLDWEDWLLPNTLWSLCSNDEKLASSVAVLSNQAFNPFTYLKQGTAILRDTLSSQEVRAFTFLRGSKIAFTHPLLSKIELYMEILYYWCYCIWYYFYALFFSLARNSIWLLPFYAFGAKILPVFWVLWVYKRAAF